MQDRPARAPASLEVWIEGLRDRLAGGGLARLGPIRISYGEPVPLDDLTGLAPREAGLTATERLIERIYDLYERL